MMHGHEKSDHAIVAVKPANKAEEPSAARPAGEPHAAEPVEPRAGTEGNANQQSTRRTQCRESVSQAMERIRKVARERKKERFTALFHHISADLLEEAFFELKENAAPAGLHPQAGWSAATDRGCSSGGQDRPTGGSRVAERDLRGRLPRVLVWVPAWARHA